MTLLPHAFAAMGTEGRILRAAMECIVRQGIAATTTHAIARAAGVNQGVIHYHFRDKNELLMRLLHLIFGEGLKMMDEVLASDLPARRKVERVFELGRRFITKRGDVFTVYIVFWAHAVAQGGQWQRSYQALLERLIAAIGAIIREGERSGEFRAEASTAAAALFLACVQGLGLQSVMGLTAFKPRRVAAYLKLLMDFLVQAPLRNPGAGEPGRGRRPTKPKRRAVFEAQRSRPAGRELAARSLASS